MTSSARIVTSHPGAPWLPPDGVADVLHAPGGRVPAPVGLVRLLLTRGAAILAVPRHGRDGLDLPTATVAPGADPETCVRRLADDLGARSCPPTLLGYVRNTVPTTVPTHRSGYPWPVPHAYFVVWHSTVPDGEHLAGEWLDPVRARTELATRHWWPLASTLPSSAPVAASVDAT